MSLEHYLIISQLIFAVFSSYDFYLLRPSRVINSILSYDLSSMRRWIIICETIDQWWWLNHFSLFYYCYSSKYIYIYMFIVLIVKSTSWLNLFYRVRGRRDISLKFFNFYDLNFDKPPVFKGKIIRFGFLLKFPKDEGNLWRFTFLDLLFRTKEFLLDVWLCQMTTLDFGSCSTEV